MSTPTGRRWGTAGIPSGEKPSRRWDSSSPGTRKYLPISMHSASRSDAPMQAHLDQQMIC